MNEGGNNIKIFEQEEIGMSTKDNERCLKISIHFLNAVLFSNQFFGTSKEARGEEIIGFGVSSPGDFDDSPFSDLMEE